MEGDICVTVRLQIVYGKLSIKSVRSAFEESVGNRLKKLSTEDNKELLQRWVDVLAAVVSCIWLILINKVRNFDLDVSESKKILDTWTVQAPSLLNDLLRVLYFQCFKIWAISCRILFHMATSFPIVVEDLSPSNLACCDFLSPWCCFIWERHVCVKFFTLAHLGSCIPYQ